jgi:hypothetical protein
VQTAVKEIVNFYRVYHSSRYVRDLFVVRLTRRLPDLYVAALAEEFRDIITDGRIEQRRAFAVERTDQEAWHLPRLVFRFNRVGFGRLRQLLDAVNAAPDE